MLGALLRSMSLIKLLPKAHCEPNHSGKHNGLGEEYIWAESLDNGLKLAKSIQKPVMLIIHKSWCKACTNFKPKFAASEDIRTLSSYFVMVNVMDEEEPMESQFAPDGTYIPRILFLSANGNVLKDVYNTESVMSARYKYFYNKPEHVTKAMKKIISRYKHYTSY